MLTLTSGTQSYTLPEWLLLKGLPFSVRAETADRALSHGAVFTGDGKVKAREIVVSGSSKLFATRAEHDAVVRDLTAALLRGKQKLVVDDGTVAYYINISSVADFSHSYESLWGRRISNFEITLLATDPFIYSMNETQVNQAINGAPSRFTVTNPSAEVYPVITITATSSMPFISLTNLSDEGRVMTYADTQFTAGKVTVIDCINGTVTRDGANTINSFGGAFLRLLPGDNLIEFGTGEISGKTCTISIVYRQRWL